ncbi:MAG: tyrosine recombinase [Anaerolineales bacterium]|nr:tyrosine recombinase [Anaerolineales bacterium]MCB8951585.1 tyrosine recombinase [Ardenticatenales bacterium]
MEEQLAAFLEFLQTERSYSENTTAAYKNDLGQFVSFLTNNYSTIASWNAVTSAIVANYVTSMKDSDYASSTVARKVAALKSFFHYLNARELTESDPTQQIDSPKVEKRLPNTLSNADIEQLLQAPTKEQTPKHLRDSALLALLYATGMRVTEVVSLTVDDINLEDMHLHSPGRDGDEARFLPFDAGTTHTLRQYLEKGRPHLRKRAEEKALFLNHRGQQLTRQGLWLIIKAYAKEANLSENVTPHTLRHSFAAHKLQSGSNLQTVQQLLGHANISTTQIYAQIDKNDTDEEE